MSKAKVLGISLILATIILATCTIRIAYAVNEGTSESEISAFSNDISHLQQNYDLKTVEEESKTTLTSYDVSGPKGSNVDVIYGLTDKNDTSSSGIKNSFGNHGEIIGGIVTTIDKGLGNKHGYKAWQSITKTNAKQYQLIKTAGMNFDGEGFGKINGRYVIACTKTFGDIGDCVDFYQNDGLVFHCIIGDHKEIGAKNTNHWGSQNGKQIVDFLVDKETWYNKKNGGNASKMHANPGTMGCHSEWGKYLVKCANGGSYYDTKNGLTTVDGTSVVDTVTDNLDTKTSSEKVKQMISILNSYSVTFKKYANQIKREQGQRMESTYSGALKKLKKGDIIYANCATCINWALIDMGMMNDPGFYYKNGGSWRGVEPVLDKHTKVITKANGMTTTEAAKKGYLKYGDIVGLNVGGAQHTFVYAGTDSKGNLLNYESGGDARKANNKVQYPNGCGPFKLGYKKYKIGSILRFTD